MWFTAIPHYSALSYNQYPFVCSWAAFPWKRCDPGVCVYLSTCLPHLPFWRPFTNISYLWEKDKGLKVHVCVDTWQHSVTCPGCLAQMWELTGAPCMSCASPAPSVPTRGDQTGLEDGGRSTSITFTLSELGYYKYLHQGYAERLDI